MSKSQRLRMADVRQAFRIVGDCRDLGDNLQSWVARAIDGLRLATHSVMTCGVHAADPDLAMVAAPGRNVWDSGWNATERERLLWLDFLKSNRHLSYQTAQDIFSIPGSLVIRTRSDLISQRDWERSSERNDDRRAVGQDDTLIGLNRWNDGRCSLAFSLNRAWGEPRFEPRDRAFLRLFCQELFSLPDTILARDDQGTLRSLSPRLRQVLLALCEGDGEKQVALRLGLSRHTVHDLVKELYRRFHVTSRGELLAAYFRRRPPHPPNDPSSQNQR